MIGTGCIFSFISIVELRSIVEPEGFGEQGGQLANGSSS